MIKTLQKFARVTLNAEKSTMFLLDKESDDLQAELFEQTENEEFVCAARKNQKVRLPQDKGIAAIVAKTGVTINVKDAYEDARFNKEIDQKTGHITRSILCMAIKGSTSDDVIGVIQVINKKTGASFTPSDEVLLRTFANYCAIIVCFNKTKQHYHNLKHLEKIFAKISKLQFGPCIHDKDYYYNNLTVEAPEDFESYKFFVSPKDQTSLPQLCVYILTDLVPSSEIDVNATMEFILTLRKYYRNNPFHNFGHGFSTMHCMYLMLKANLSLFSPIEIKALLIAALCHDIDHSGFTNAFLELVNDDLTYLTKDAMNERNACYVTAIILNSIKVFPNMTEETYQQLLEEINFAIISKHPAQFFNCSNALTGLLKTKKLSWNDKLHRSYIKGIMMMAADTCCQIKPFLVSKGLTEGIFVELYRQGDLERTMNLCPLPKMDRQKANKIPEIQIDHLSTIIIPCYELLRKLLPNTQTMYKDAIYLRNTWQELIDISGLKCWRQDDSLV